MKKIILLFSAFLFISLYSTSQWNYFAANVVNTTGTYNDLGTTGSAITTNFSAAAMTFDDDNSSVQNIGFSFNYNGAAFTQFVLNTNGFIRLGSTAPSANFFYNTITGSVGGPIDAADANLIYPFCHDLMGGTSPEYRVQTSGSVGSRVCTIQFKSLVDKIGTATQVQYSNMNFQIKLYETTGKIEFVYGTWAANANASTFKSAAVGIKGAAAANSVNGTKSSASLFSTTTFLNGNYTGNTHNHRNGFLPDAGRTYIFLPTYPNDAAVSAVYYFGKQSKPSLATSSISAVITNAGTTALGSFNVTLNVTGANTFTNTKNIVSLAVGVSTTITFDNFTPANSGTNNISVSLPSDDNLLNNSWNNTQEINSNTFSHAYGASPSGGVGSNTAALELLQKYTTSIPIAIDQITPFFNTSGQPFLVTIRDASGTGGSPGTTTLWESAVQPSAVAGPNVVAVPSIAVNGDFYVGVRQTGATNFGIGYQTENPVRPNSFTSPSPFDVHTALTSSFKIMVDVRHVAVVPVNLTTFSGVKNGATNKLSWVTSDEKNNKGFELERSADGDRFSTIEFVASKANNGNSVGTLEYEFIDAKPFKTVSYYRLKQVDFDGKSTYSKVVAIRDGRMVTFDISDVYPNPASEKINVVVSSIAEKNASFIVTDLIGKVVLQQNMKVINGETNVQLNVSNLTAGNYMLKVVCDDGCESATKKFIKQ